MAKAVNRTPTTSSSTSSSTVGALSSVMETRNLYDRGFHVLVGNDKALGLFKEWMQVLLMYVFLEEPRTRIVYGEPRMDNEMFINRLVRNGFERVLKDEVQSIHGTTDINLNEPDRSRWMYYEEGSVIVMPHKKSVLLGYRRETFERKYELYLPVRSIDLLGSKRQIRFSFVGTNNAKNTKKEKSKRTLNGVDVVHAKL
jgi:hypothetical protein